MFANLKAGAAVVKQNQALIIKALAMLVMANATLWFGFIFLSSAVGLISYPSKLMGLSAGASLFWGVVSVGGCLWSVGAMADYLEKMSADIV